MKIKRLKSDLNWVIKKDLTNGICASGSNIAIARLLLKNKYISKKKLKKVLKTQMEFLDSIEKAKDKLLEILKK